MFNTQKDGPFGLVYGSVYDYKEKKANFHQSPITSNDFIYLRRHDKVVLGEAADGVGPKLNSDLAPADGHFGVVAFGFGDISYFICERERRLEVGKRERLHELGLFE